MKVKVCIDKQRFSTKPTKADTAAITKRIATYTTELSISDLAKELVQPNGKSFTPAWFRDGKRSNETWMGQSVFGLDFDIGITIEQVMARCKEYNILPAFAYTTFSSVNNNKFRVIFQTVFEVNEIRVAKLIQLGLLAVFPEADNACKDPSRLFYGGKELISMSIIMQLLILVL